MFLCVDMEGGTVDRLKNAIAPAPSAEAVASTQDKKIFRAHGRLIGEEVRALGFNTDFAPVLDLSFAASRSVLTSRTVSDDPKQAVIYAREFLKGLREARVLGCGKHFPGLGEANLDTHEMLPLITKPWKRLWAEDLYPYRALRREMAFVMVAHAAYPAVTKSGIPASLSTEMDDRDSAPQDRLSRAGGLRRSRNGRRAGVGAHRRSRGRDPARRRRHVPGLPQRGARLADLRGGGARGRARPEIRAPGRGRRPAGDGLQEEVEGIEDQRGAAVRRRRFASCAQQMQKFADQVQKAGAVL